MGKRIISGAMVALLAVISILVGGTWLAGVLLVVSCTAYRELCKATGVHQKKGLDILEMTGYLGIVIYYFLIWFGRPGSATEMDIQLYLFMLCICMLMLMMTVYVITFPTYRFEQITAAYFNIIYAPVMLSFIYLTEQMESGIYIVWMIFISSWVCDTCAYFVGVTIGKHRLAPVLSPKKSVEGSIGGIAGSMLVGALYAYIFVIDVMPDKNVIFIFAAIGGIGAVISQIGDLAASAIKRNHEIKDYGTCIPGHGGIMDRFDSVIFTAPMIYFMARLMIGL